MEVSSASVSIDSRFRGGVMHHKKHTKRRCCHTAVIVARSSTASVDALLPEQQLDRDSNFFDRK
jgi:hypothetical protein